MVPEPNRASSSNLQTASRNSTTNNTKHHTQTILSFDTPIKLDRMNYLLWHSQVLTSIGAIDWKISLMEQNQHLRNIFF